MRFRTACYRAQQQERERMSSKPARRKRRPRATALEAWGHMESLSIKLNRALEDLFEAMRQQSPAGLSHIRKQLKEEWPIPSCEVHLTGDGAWQRVRTQDVQC